MKRFFVDSILNSAKMNFKRITRQTYSKAAVMENREKYLSMSFEEKRKIYKCGDKYVTLDQVPMWSLWHAMHGKKDVEVKELINKELNSKIGVFLGDITCLEIDCIVNAANKTLLGGGGVDGAIHRAAGPLLYEECTTLNGCETSEAKITAGYNLPAKYVIHTVGPIGYDPEALEKAYINSLNLAIQNKCRSIAFPCISTGIYGFPNEKASKIVTKTVRDFLEKNHENFDRIIFCLFMQKDIDLYNNYLSMYFPVSKTENVPSKRTECENDRESKSEVKDNEKSEKSEEPPEIKEAPEEAPEIKEVPEIKKEIEEATKQTEEVEQSETKEEKFEIKQEEKNNETEETNITAESNQEIENKPDNSSVKEESK